MKHLASSNHFQRLLRKLPRNDQERAADALKRLLEALRTGVLPAGLGLKKINGDKYELRVDLRLRIVMKADGDTLVCHLIGNHDEVRRYLRSFRTR